MEGGGWQTVEQKFEGYLNGYNKLVSFLCYGRTLV